MPCHRSIIKKRRGLYHSLGKEFEGGRHRGSQNTWPRAAKRLEALDQEYRQHHTSLIDLIEDEEALSKEQQDLDAHDDEVSLLTVEIEQVIAACSSKPESSTHKAVLRRISHLKKSVSQVKEDVGALDEGSDVCLLQHLGEQIADVKKQLQDVTTSVLSLEIEDDDVLFQDLASLEKGLSQCSLDLRRLVSSHSAGSSLTPSTRENSGVKLPKLDVPTFDGNLLNWRSFWEQFCISVAYLYIIVRRSQTLRNSNSR